LIEHCLPNVPPRPPLKQALAPPKSDRKGGDKISLPVVVGSNRLWGNVTYDDPGPSDQLITLLNRKRNADSVALEESALKDMTQRHAPKKRRRKKAS